jgi:hypothetical protein
MSGPGTFRRAAPRTGSGRQPPVVRWPFTTPEAAGRRALRLSEWLSSTSSIQWCLMTSVSKGQVPPRLWPTDTPWPRRAQVSRPACSSNAERTASSKVIARPSFQA